MGLSAFWTAIKRPRFSDSSSESRKHVDRVQDQRHTAAHVRPTPNAASHHLDPIYDAHHHTVAGRSQGPTREPSSPPRINTPVDTKLNRKSSIWRSASQNGKPSQPSEPAKPLKTEKSTKRRSFWQSEPKLTTTAPPVRKPEPVSSTSSRNAEVKKAERNSHWRPEASFEPERLLSESDADATDVKTKRLSRRLSLHRNASSKSSGSRNSLRFNFLAGGADDSDDDNIPAMPPIPVNLQRQKSRSKDPGRSLGVGGPVQPGTAITTDDTASQNKRNSMNRRSLSKLMTNRKSTTDIEAADDQSGNGNKRKRRSWFSVHGSESSPDTAIPPMPALPSSNLPVPSNLDPAEAAFHRFLHNVHNAAPKGAVTTDFERFLDASRDFDASVPTPPNLSHRNSMTDLQTSPRPAVGAFIMPGFGLQKRSTIAVQPTKSRASHCRPTKLNTTNIAGRQISESESPTEQREWSKLRHNMMNDSASPESSGEWNRESDEDDDGVMGMLRELSRDERYEAHHKAEKRRRDRERYLGVGTFENRDALAALEFGARGVSR